jgi:hypothetical protein
MTSVELTTTMMTMETSGTRQASMESNIKIQLNSMQSSSMVMTKIPASGLMDRRNNGVTTPAGTVD